MVKADQEEAARYAEATLGGGHTLSRLLLEVCPLWSGRYEWSVEPAVGSPGDWYDPGDVAPTMDVLGMREWFTRLMTNVVRGDDVLVVESAIVEQDRSFVPHFEGSGARAVFKDVDDGAETYLVVEPGRVADGIDKARGFAGGAYRVVGAVAALPIGAIPPNGADVSDETLRAIAENATHVFFRGPSYDGLVVWTAPAAAADKG